MMDPLQNLHYAIGELAYAIAFSDGEVQKEEREKFHYIVEEELSSNDYDFDISEIIFKLLDKDRSNAATSYNSAIKEIKTNSHYLSPELKQKTINVMRKVAEAFPPVTEEENRMMEMFKKDIENVIGDPVFYSTSK